MPKAKWQDDDLASAIENADASGGNDYTGELPKAGLYRWTLVQAKKGESNNGGDKIRWIWKLDGSWKPAHKEYDGAPLFDHMPMGVSSAFRAKQVCAALGISARDLLSGIHDDDGVFTKLGNLVLKDKTVTAYINVKVESQEGYEPSLRVRGYVQKPDKDEDGSADEATPAAKPAKGGKKAKETAPEPEAKPEKASKKGKKGKAESDEPPF